jgi:Na+:H+ antiporter, NhaA family
VHSDPPSRSKIRRFFQVEAASGIVLLLATALALVWTNSTGSASYEGFWTGAPRLIVNDLLMSLFFLLVGLEIRRELSDGELSGPRRALVPLMAAAGGVVIPALIYISIASVPDLRRGWAIPTATDIAFAIGVLTLLGNRVPAPVRVLLLALAIIDDIAAVLVIGLFYSAGFHAAGFLLAATGVGLLLLLQRFGARSALAYVLPGVLLWVGFRQAGVHPTLAGALLGLLIRSEHAERILHPWVAFGIMPLFAFANAGVTFGLALEGAGGRVTLAIILALVVGKPLGISLFTWGTIRLRLGLVSDQLTWRGVALVACLGGIGFTVSLFVTPLAFSDAALIAASKSAILLASASAALLGLLLGRFVLFPHDSRRPGQRPPRA